ncbi:rubrerythrin-like domain-containing protein [Natrialba taiwanensis]
MDTTNRCPDCGGPMRNRRISLK